MENKKTRTESETIKNNLHEAVTFVGDVFSELEALRKENAELKARLGEETADNVPESSFDCLAVTNVQVFPFKEGPSLGHIKGLAQIVLNDQFQLRGLRIMEGENGIFVSYPLDPFFKGEEYRSLAYPITRQLREHIEACVLEKYNQTVNKEA